MMCKKIGNYTIWQMPVYISYLQASTKAGQHQNPIRESFAWLIVERRVKRLPNLTYVSFKIPLLVTKCLRDITWLKISLILVSRASAH